MALLILIITPFIAALSSLVIRKKVWPLEVIAAIAAPIELLAMIVSVSNVFLHKSYTFSSYFALDSLGTIVLLTISLVGFASSFYSIGYLREEVKKGIIGFHRVRQYFILFHLFLMAMFFAIMTVNPIMMWLAIEATTLSTAFLISFYNKPSSMEAAWKYLMVNSIGLLLGFFGTLLFLTPSVNIPAASFVDWHTLSANSAFLNPVLIRIAFIFILIGYGTKAGLAPMHTWLPDAHSKAPSPISALLSGALLNVALMAILRFKIVTDSVVGAGFSQTLLIFFGILSIAIPAFIIIVQKSYKRLFAYSSIEHMGIMALGFGFGGIGTFGALLHMLYHSLTKSILFFSAGNIFLKYSSTKIENIKDVLSSLPITGVILILGFLAIIGMPPFGIFMTEFYILSAGISRYPVLVGLVIALLALIFIGFLKQISSMALTHTAETKTGKESNYLTLIPAIFLLCLFIIASLFLPLPIKTFIEETALLLH